MYTVQFHDINSARIGVLPASSRPANKKEKAFNMTPSNQFSSPTAHRRAGSLEAMGILCLTEPGAVELRSRFAYLR
jgi:hypothetical protein